MVWKAPAVATDNRAIGWPDKTRLIVNFKGPDSEDADTGVELSAHLLGYHFKGEEQADGNKQALDHTVKPGLGVRLFFLQPPDPQSLAQGLSAGESYAPNAEPMPFADTRSDLPSLEDLENKTLNFVPSAVARLLTLDLRNHKEWVDALQNEAFPTHSIVVLAEVTSLPKLSCPYVLPQ